ncbi:LrgB-like family-domain-containing protein [Daldinia caldariorum]|uniref:LrgB-like family-domain-containing protein n=1 Tax=Daldinia caldariorum TaxID=326644 RepID=UPI002007EE7D|nr:LrgB-like family-domain-containing protein [Daldinia caldariorum]KAI1469249.1 LrgB-like family-domain-containing protein [Daldinia caldariorum]
MNSLIQHLCRAIRKPETVKRYRDAGIGLAFIVLSQLLVFPVQIALDLNSINLPASILVMLLLSSSMIIANYIHGGTEKLYMKYLCGPTNFLGRHMSFGFVASFLLLNRDHISDPMDVPRIIGSFVTITVAGYISSYLIALGIYKLELRLRSMRKRVPDIENGHRPWPSPSAAWPAPPTDRNAIRLDRLPQISEVAVSNDGSWMTTKAAKGGRAYQLVEQFVRTGPLWICMFLIAVVGLPVYFATDYEAPFEALFFTLFWTSSVQLQRSLKSSYSLLRHPRLRSIVVIFANPVLVTWGIGTAYLWIKTAYREQSIDITVTEFRQHRTLSAGILAITEGGKLSSNIGAGDLSGPILDAGIICMGFKMFEYRKELWKSLHTVLITCALLSVANIFLNVMLARALGLQPADALAFAARSVTIALGVPAVGNLGGSTVLMSALVIFGGIIFQMGGDWLFSLFKINDREGHDAARNSTTASVGSTEAYDDNETQRRSAKMDNAVVAAGVTVGINAAAMGTAHLIERDSRATAYSALSMTVFGAMTVALTAIPIVSDTIESLAIR